MAIPRPTHTCELAHNIQTTEGGPWSSTSTSELTVPVLSARNGTIVVLQKAVFHVVNHKTANSPLLKTSAQKTRLEVNKLD